MKEVAPWKLVVDIIAFHTCKIQNGFAFVNSQFLYHIVAFKISFQKVAKACNRILKFYVKNIMLKKIILGRATPKLSVVVNRQIGCLHAGVAFMFPEKRNQ